MQNTYFKVNVFLASPGVVLFIVVNRVATVWEKDLENEIFSRSGKCQGILRMAREI